MNHTYIYIKITAAAVLLCNAYYVVREYLLQGIVSHISFQNMKCQGGGGGGGDRITVSVLYR